MGEDEYRQPVAAAAHFFRLTSIRRNPSLTLVRSGNADARFRGLVGVPTYQQGLSNPSCSSCRREGGARSCRKGPGHPPDASILFFFKPDGFRETCLSFHVASLLLIWALKLCDRASSTLSGKFVEETLITVDGKWKSHPWVGTVGRARALRGADGEARSRALSLSRPEGAGGRAPAPACGHWRPARPRNVFHADWL